ncbi:MAG: hypothetical protein COB20_06820 [SAR86 cluster bacterium]|uniref:Uncharacterized protein n=1 Tax=SAR86 cluster bacterium TaxID=2030880 RepID=A0A2A4X6S5_9GAMM|nr:MAG: hypothetical protein COB20_06820 [SAR86 cluster bacterium]
MNMKKEMAMLTRAFIVATIASVLVLISGSSMAESRTVIRTIEDACKLDKYRNACPEVFVTHEHPDYKAPANGDVCSDGEKGNMADLEDYLLDEGLVLAPRVQRLDNARIVQNPEFWAIKCARVLDRMTPANPNVLQTALYWENWSLIQSIFRDITRPYRNTINVNIVFMNEKGERETLLDWLDHAIEVSTGVITERLEGTRAKFTAPPYNARTIGELNLIDSQ